MKDTHKWLISIHASVALFSIMASILFFVFEFIDKPQIIFAAFVSFCSLETMLFFRTRLNSKVEHDTAAN